MGPVLGRFGRRVLHVPVDGLVDVAGTVNEATAPFGQAPVQPGSRTARSRSSTSSAVVRVDRSGQNSRNTRRSGSGAHREYQRVRGIFGHSDRGRNRTVVSAIAAASR